jgi:ABC-type glutathione transport system ATPase component
MSTTPATATLVQNLVLETVAGKRLVDDVGFTVAPGETLGLVGESGSGKSLTLKALLGLLPSGVVQTGGTIRREGRCAMVFQDPVRALDPLCPVVSLVAEVVRHNQGTDRRDSRTKALELLTLLGLPSSLAVHDRYPRQLSGGQCQRVVIALALARRPDVLLCDEPTTALDVTVQKQILEVIANLQKELGFAMVFVTHNLAVASSLCSRLVVLKEGRIVEAGATDDVLGRPQHPYTQKLIQSVLSLPDRAGAPR